MIGPIDVRFDVTAALSPAVAGGRPQWIGGRIFAPARLDPAAVTPVVVCLHGGSYDQRYFHPNFPGWPGYSMAEHFATRGVVVLTIDYLGVGDSSRPASIKGIDRHVAAAAHHAAAAQAFALLKEGRLTSSIPALPRIDRVGLAHSMGVMLQLTQQARWRTYDKIALLGYSVVGVTLDRPPEAQRSLDPSQYGDEIVVDRKSLRRIFFLEDVPPEIIALDEATAVTVPSLIGLQAQMPNIVAEDVQAIDVPVFFALGERDLSPKPHEETARFTGTTDVAFLIVKGSAHNHNFATTRAVLWDRILTWIPATAPTSR